MSQKNPFRGILKWAGAVLLWCVYALAIGGMTTHSGPAYLMPALLLLPIVIVLLCWLYIQGPQQIGRSIGRRFKRQTLD